MDYSFVVTENIPVVSYYLASFINEKIPSHVNVHLIGFSLGGQISGIAARTLTMKTERTIDRISGEKLLEKLRGSGFHLQKSWLIDLRSF